MEIVPATPHIWPAVAELFAAGGDPKWCWCQWWRKPGSNWTNTNPEENRRDLEALVGVDPAPGLVALVDGAAVGWVGLGPREDFGRLARSRTIPQLSGEECLGRRTASWSPGRPGGPASRPACSRRPSPTPASTTHAWSRATPSGSRAGDSPAAAAYTGTETMFERAGFTFAAETTSRAGATAPRVVMRRSPRRPRRSAGDPGDRVAVEAGRVALCGEARSGRARRSPAHRSSPGTRGRGVRPKVAFVVGPWTHWVIWFARSRDDRSVSASAPANRAAAHRCRSPPACRRWRVACRAASP